MKNAILKKIDNREIVAGVIGLGYVGLPLAMQISAAGFKTIGFDVNAEKVLSLNAGTSHVGDVTSKSLKKHIQENRLSFTADFTRITEVGFIAICVPTPLDKNQQPDISYVKDSAGVISRYLTKGTMVVLESTTYPGTTEELLLPLLEKSSGLRCGNDFYLGYSPERIDPGNKKYSTGSTPKIVGGVGGDALELIARMYDSFITAGIHSVSSASAAEMAKILENTYRHVNIGLINEMAIICNRMGINIWEVIDAAKTKPFGYQPFYPGPGLGGHCIPLDPQFFSWKAREYGFHTSMIEASSVVNDRMPEYVVSRASKILNRNKKPLNGSKVLVLGVAYKQDIADYRESPALKVASVFEANDSIVSFYDPYVPKFTYNGTERSGLPSLDGELNKYDIIVITTAHSGVEYDVVANSGVPVLDCKNACKDVINRTNIELI